MGVALGAVALAGGAGRWSSLSRECAYTPQAAEVTLTNDDAPHAYPYAPATDTTFAHGPTEVALNAPRLGRASAHTTRHAVKESRGRVRAESGERGASVARKEFRGGSGKNVEMVADAALDVRVNVAALVSRPEAARQVRAAWSVTQTHAKESAGLGAGSPRKCLKEIHLPDASKPSLPVVYMMSEMVERREPYVYIAPLLHALDAVASAAATPHKDEAEKDEKAEASLPAVSRPECTGEETLPSGSSESPTDAPDGGSVVLPPSMDCKAESPQED